MACSFCVLKDGRRWAGLVLLESGLKGAGCFPNVVLRTVIALYVVDGTTLLKGMGGVLNMGELVAQSIVWFVINCASMLLE